MIIFYPSIIKFRVNKPKKEARMLTIKNIQIKNCVSRLIAVGIKFCKSFSIFCVNTPSTSRGIIVLQESIY